MEHQLRKYIGRSIILLAALIGMGIIAEQQFTKPKKQAPLPKVKVEDVCSELVALQEAGGNFLVEYGAMQAGLAQLVQGCMENNKSAPLMKASQKQLQDLVQHITLCHRILVAGKNQLEALNTYVATL